MEIEETCFVYPIDDPTAEAYEMEKHYPTMLGQEEQTSPVEFCVRLHQGDVSSSPFLRHR